MKTGKALLAVADVAEILEIKTADVRELILNGTLKADRAGRDYGVDAEDLVRFIVEDRADRDRRRLADFTKRIDRLRGQK